MNFKLALIYLAFCVSVFSCGPIENKADTDDEIIEPEDALQGATTPAPLGFLEKWDEWQIWEAPEKFPKLAPYFKTGYDLGGLSIIIIQQFGKWNYRELASLKLDDRTDFLRYYEQFIRRAQKEGAANNDAGIVLICDWDGFSLGSFASRHAMELALKTFTSIIRLNDAVNYAYEINSKFLRLKVFIENSLCYACAVLCSDMSTNLDKYPPANFAAETFVNVARPFYGTYLEKFEVYGSQREKWRTVLLRKIASSQLPPEYGGDKGWKPVPWNK